MPHDINLRVVTKIQYFWGNRPARGLSFGQLEGSDRALWPLKDLPLPLFYFLDTLVFLLHALLQGITLREKKEPERHRDNNTISTMAGGDSSEDARQLAALGHAQELNRTFSPLAMLGLAFAILNSWTALATSLGLALSSGGPTSVLWGLITAGICNLCLAASLAEFLSAYPSAGGQYHWAAMLCPNSRMISWITGWINVSNTPYSHPHNPNCAMIVLTHSLLTGRWLDGPYRYWWIARIATYPGHHLVDGLVLQA